MSEDLEVYFQPISDEMPSGPDLEYDPEFARMEKLAQGTPEQEMGSTLIEAVPPDWDEVLQVSRQLMAKSKDLRIVSHYVMAKMMVSGLLGLRDGLKVISTLLDRFWESLYPLLDEDDDNDPTSRVNALLSLATAGGLVRHLRDVTILESRTVGRFSVIDCAIAKGEMPVPAGMAEPPTQKKIDAAVQSCDANQLKERLEAAEEGLKCIAAIDAVFIERAGYGTGPNLELLTKELKTIVKYLKPWQESRSEASSAGAPTGLTEYAPSSDGKSSQVVEVMAHAAGFSSQIRCREDALDALDRIIQWFERYEPSSPLPMLLKRAKRLSTLSFIEILKDISPEGLNQALLVGGPDAVEPEPKPAPKEMKESNSRSNYPRHDEY